MEMKILWAGAIFFGGWLWFYLFGRQLVFNFRIALPMVKKMNTAREGLVAPGAGKYTWISNLLCLLLLAVGCSVVIRFCRLYLIIFFFVGFAVAFVTYFITCKITTPSVWDLFCSGYYRFVPDDELRTAIYNKDMERIKRRLYDMDVPRDFLPKLKKK